MTDDWLRNENWLRDDIPLEDPETTRPDQEPHAEPVETGGAPTWSETPAVPTEVMTALTALLNAPVEPHADARVQRLRRVSRRAYLPWSAEEDRVLLALSDAGFSLADLTTTLCRQPGAIRTRLLRLIASPDGVNAYRQDREKRRQHRLERRKERRERSPANRTEVDVQLPLVVPHFEAWYALLQGGTAIRVLHGDQHVFTMTPAPPRETAEVTPVPKSPPS